MNPWLQQRFGPWVLRLMGVEYASRANLEFEAGSGIDLKAEDKPETNATKLRITALGGGSTGPTITNAGTGTLDNVPSTDESGALADMIRFTGSDPATVTGIAGGARGRKLRLVSKGNPPAPITLKNQNGGSGASNQIVTGTGGDVTVPAGGAIELVYDGTSGVNNRWHVVGGPGGGGGATPGGSVGQYQRNNGAGGFEADNTFYQDQGIPVAGSDGLGFEGYGAISTVYSLATASQGVALPDASGTVVLHDATQTLTKKTILGSTGASAAIPALAIDWASANVFTKTLGAGANTFTFANAADGQTIIVVLTGASSTVTWPTVKWAGGTPPTQTPSGTDVYTFVKAGATIYGSVVQAMA